MNKEFNQLIKKASFSVSPISETPLLDAEILLAHSLGTTREQLILRPPVNMEKETLALFSHLIQKRSSGIPIAYLTGKKNFYENDFTVNKHVLIPRPETELIAEIGIELVISHEKPVVLDVGTGSGCIPISIAKYAPHGKFIATDISTNALAVARLNAEREELDDIITFLESSLMKDIPKMHFTLITANLPYLPTHDAKTVSKLYSEPFEALNGGFFGYELYQKLFKELQVHTFDHMLLEADPRHIKQLKQVAIDHIPNIKIKTTKDLAGLNRILHIKKKN